MTPKIRFYDFSDEWKSHPFEEVAKRVSTSKYDESIPSVEYEDIDSKSGKLNKDITKKTVHKRGQFFETGDILFGKLRPYLHNNYQADFDGIAVGDFWIFKNGIAVTSFIYPFISSREFSYVSNLSVGSKMPRSDWGLVSSWKFHIPENKREQIRIGQYFKHVDLQISNIGKELQKLRQLKAASLQAMFPQEGETAPRLRFKGFEGEWTRQTIGSVFSECTERGSFDNLLSVSISRGVYPTEDFVKTHTVQDFSNYKSVHPGYIVYNSMRMWQGASGVSNYSGIVSPAYTILCPNEKVDSTFIAYLFKLPWMIKTFEANSQGLTKDTWNLKYPAISVIDVCIPSDIREQKKIADFFLNLDKQIKLTEKELEKLRQIKASCLDLMFV